MECTLCRRQYPITGDNILQMMPSDRKPLPDTYSDPDYLKMSENFDDSSDYFTAGNPIFTAIHNSSHKTIAAWAGSNDSEWTCDIGCGQGYHFAFQKDLTKVIGVDIRYESLIRVRKHFQNVLLIQGDSTRLPFKDGVIRRCISVYALEHIYYLDDALEDTLRIMKSQGEFHVGIPCEGGLAWNLGRKLTSERTMSKRYKVDYKKYIALEHCNAAAKITQSLKAKFTVKTKRYFPLPFLPSINLNLTSTLRCIKP